VVPYQKYGQIHVNNAPPLSAGTALQALLFGKFFAKLRDMQPPYALCVMRKNGIIHIMPKKEATIMTTRQTGGLHKGYKPMLPASA